MNGSTNRAVKAPRQTYCVYIYIYIYVCVCVCICSVYVGLERPLTVAEVPGPMGPGICIWRSSGTSRRLQLSVCVAAERTLVCSSFPQKQKQCHPKKPTDMCMWNCHESSTRSIPTLLPQTLPSNNKRILQSCVLNPQ